MTRKHLSTQFDIELGEISTRVLEMGGLVEGQLEQAVLALVEASKERAAAVLEQEERVNRMEVEIDGELSAIIARRQPAARDLRLLIAISKASANLERAGDEAARIARVALRLTDVGTPNRLPLADLQHEALLAAAQLRQSLSALARMDASLALEVLKQDDQIDREFDGLLRKLITHMMEDPRTISACIDVVFVAKAIERVGDHAKNLAEATIYVVKGTDVRHAAMVDVESVVR
jgi:phosphate transport system protein